MVQNFVQMSPFEQFRIFNHSLLRCLHSSVVLHSSRISTSKPQLGSLNCSGKTVWKNYQQRIRLFWPFFTFSPLFNLALTYKLNNSLIATPKKEGIDSTFTKVDYLFIYLFNKHLLAKCFQSLLLIKIYITRIKIILSLMNKGIYFLTNI